MSSSAAQTKMCSISVEPMPSMSRTPVASCTASHVAAGRCSPADTARRSCDSCAAFPDVSMARYAVGAVKQIVTRCWAMRSASWSGVAFSTSSVAAPTRSGKISSPPSPKVKASGGVPVKTSSAVGFSTWAEKVSAIASTSRWKCMVALGRPVVPDVKASRATSSAAVSTAGKTAGFCAAAAARAVSGP